MAYIDIAFALLWGIGTLLVLIMAYAVLFKMLKWRGELAEILIPRTRLWVYLLFYTVSIWQLVEHMPEANWVGGAMTIVEGATWLLVTVIICEIVSATTFDYVMAVRRKQEVPAIFLDLARLGLFLVVLGLLFKLVWHIDLTGLLAASGVVAVMIGFALQTVLGDLFAGLAMQVTRPYALGDWIKVADKEGVVEKIDWRATTLRTIYHDYMVLPNSKLAKEPIYNFSQPDPLHFHYVYTRTHYRHAPGHVKHVIAEALKKVHHIRHDKKPEILVNGFEDFWLNWQVKYWIDDYSHYLAIESEVREKIWYAFRREGIEVPLPQIQARVLEHHDEQEQIRRFALKLFDQIDWLKKLPQEERAYLAERVKPQLFTHHEVVFHQGEPGACMYLIHKGRIQIEGKQADGTVYFTKELGPGNFVGEMALLTGEPRTATVRALDESELLMLDKTVFRRIVEENPDAVETISNALAARESELSKEKQASLARQEGEAATATVATNRSAELLSKIKNFFSY